MITLFTTFNIIPRKFVSMIFLVSSLIIAQFTTTTLFAQQKNKCPQHGDTKAVEKLFEQVEEGLNKGEISGFSQYFSNQTYFSLSSGQSGYYSANQAFYILHEFFKINQAISFRYTAKNLKKVAYATGVYHYEISGRRKTAQVFISLKWQSNVWQIAQFTIR